MSLLDRSERLLRLPLLQLEHRLLIEWIQKDIRLQLPRLDDVFIPVIIRKPFLYLEWSRNWPHLSL